MELKIKRSEFLNALSWTQSVVERKTTMPILSNVLIEVESEKMKISATDLEVGVVTEIGAEISQPGKICVPAKNLYEIIKELSQDEIQIRKKEQNRVEIKAGKSNFKIVGLAPEEFPNLPQPAEKQWYPLEARGLRGMMDKTLHAISSDESRYNLHGVFLQSIGEKILRMVATDGHRLCYVDREISEAIQLTKGVIIPKKAVYEIKRLVGEGVFEGDEEPVYLSLDGRNLIAKRKSVTLVARLIDGEFPDYQKVIPKSQSKTVIVSRQMLMSGLKRVSLLVNDRSRGIKFSLSSGLLELSTSNPDLGEAREEIAVEYKGDHFHIGFNARYFLEVLGVMEDEKVNLELNGEVGPCVLRSGVDKGFLSVIMPMRI